jgi:hypothetical protein
MSSIPSQSNVFIQAPPQPQTNSEILGLPTLFTGTTPGGLSFINGNLCAPRRTVTPLTLPVGSQLHAQNLFQ